MMNVNIPEQSSMALNVCFCLLFVICCSSSLIEGRESETLVEGRESKR